MASKELRPLRIVSDHVTNRENLAFGFEAYASAIAELIATKTNKTPYTIGISGKWGSGKTTLMKAVENKLKELPFDEKITKQDQEFRKIKCVWFEAWKYKDDDEILAALVEVIIRTIKTEENIFDKFKDATIETAKDSPFENIKKLSKSINYRKVLSTASKLALKIDLADFVKETEEKVTHEDFLGFYDTFNEIFEKALWEYLGTDKRYKQQDE